MKSVLYMLNIVLLSSVLMAEGQPVAVEVNFNVQRSVGGISTFDRSKFVTIHSSHTDGDWGDRYGPNFIDDVLADCILSNDVYFGRDTGYITGKLRNTINEDPERPGFAMVSNDTWSITHQGAYQRGLYDDKTEIHSYEDRLDGYIIGAQFHPFWPDGDPLCGQTDSKWAVSTNDTPAEPFGSASGHYMGHFLNNFYGNATQEGLPLPTYVEVMNEPDWPLFEAPGDPAFGSSSPEELWKYHNSVANEIRKVNSDVKIGGYCASFPDLERDDFAEWRDEWVTFIDTCGTNMDFYTIHLYDTDDSYSHLIRRGSFTEAVFDMIEHYTQLRLGKQLPFVISEYAGKDRNFSQTGWSPYMDWKRIKSMSGYLMSFMDRPDRIGKAIPFIMLKCEWGRNDTTGIPYSARLFRQEGEASDPTSTEGDWVYTEHIKWYQLWSDVNGTRVDVASSDPDIQVDAYIDSDKAYVILNNLSSTTQTVDLALSENHENTVLSVREKNLYWDESNSTVALDDIIHAGSLSQVELGSEGTAILEYTFASPVNIDQTSEEVKYYATTYFQPITNDLANVFSITNVTTGAYGEAMLRLGVGRGKTLSRRPTVLFNGQPLIVPTDFMGHEGDDRDVFFGVLEIPVPYHLLKASNSISVTYPDSGGYIGSVTLRAYAFSSDIRSLSYDIPVDWYSFMGTNLVLGFTNGPVQGYASLMTKTNLMDAVWTLGQTELPVDEQGGGMATNPAILPTAFFKFVASDTPQPPPPEPPEVTSIGFQAPDYVDSALNGQQSWNAESGWVVVDSAGAGHASTPDGSSAAVLGEPIQLQAGETFALSLNMQFGGAYITPTNYVYAFLGGLKPGNAAASVGTGEASAADANIQIYKNVDPTNADDYRLLNNYAGVSGASTIDGATGGALNEGDILQFDYELTMGADASSTSYRVRLQNLTDGTDTGFGTASSYKENDVTYSGIHPDLYNALAGSGAFAFFQTISPSGAGLSSLQVNFVSFTVIHSE